MENKSTLAKDPHEFEFEDGWKPCFQQDNCERKTGKNPPREFVWCEIKGEGCEKVGDAVCECLLFRRDTNLPKEDQRWEHVPYEGRHEKEPGYYYQCFCVRRTK